MNDLSSTVGLMRRELRDARAVLSRLDHQTRKLFEPARRKQKKAAEGPLHLDGSSIWLRPGPVSQGVPPLPCLRPYREIIGSLSGQGCSAGHTVDTKEPPEELAVHPPYWHRRLNRSSRGSQLMGWPSLTLATQQWCDAVAWGVGSMTLLIE